MSISQLAYDCIKRELGVMVEKIATLRSQLTASQERERILREGLKKYLGCRDIDGNCSVAATIKAAEEVK
jgi:hypothetical protein